ncbi:hypothetical protein [Clostridium beijerinckii]|uniref:Uncharacterized protein n=1 Tax=Clostridium beijerinckii TaxID=1520 RepID=A0AAX0AWJ1_CLOBE|nr:hypothetical protein [Clostridium beijerinckii]NOW04395.1 hypothetical protein [Clostridium beijerinckii]NRT87328.1 hypothetical protein [Clostridium beijerinckii]NRU38980.1 hypothetical protein [Clostridium beijerinckii]NSA97741.1 hypothetical protein [Clostridium beijerinckii]NYC02463.1 hypothetical protein [Clostridium beijerinckii]
MERKERMRETIVNLNLPQETKEFLLKTKIEEDEGVAWKLSIMIIYSDVTNNDI